MTANEQYFDATIRHQMDVRRFTAGEVKRALRVLEEADRALARKLRNRLGPLTSGEDFTTRRLETLLADIRRARDELFKRLYREERASFLQLATDEADLEQRLLMGTIPVDYSAATVDLAAVATATIDKPFKGLMLEEWFDTLARADQKRLVSAIREGVAQGETTDEIVRTVVGTRSQGYRDGVLATSRREAEAVVRTAINHISNASREAVWKANEQVIEKLRWTATLDGRTSKVCATRDGELYNVGEGPRPPAHVNCRSVMVPVVGTDFIGERATITDTRTRRKREIDFRAEAKASVGETKWSKMSAAQRNAMIARRRQQWAAEKIGQVPAETTFAQFFKRQDAEFQREYLGKTKYLLYKKGGLTLDQFVDRRGNELTLDQLRERHPKAFRKIEGSK